MQKASDVRKRLGKLPNSLSDSYQELYDRRYEEYEPEERKRLDIALSLLLVPHRPTDPSVFTKLVFWDEDDEDDEEDEEQEGKDESWKDGNQTGGDCASSNTGSNLEEYEYHTESDDTQSLEDGDGYENNYDPNRRPFESISRLCFDLVIFDRAIGAFRFAHTSVQDYLCNHNPNFQMMCDSHARIAERCISIILHTIERRGMVFPKLRIRGDQAQTCIHAKDYESSSNQIIDSRAKKESESDVGNGSALRLLDMRPPTCTRVHRKQVDIETLEEYAIPWEWVKASPPYLRVSCGGG